MQIPQYVVDAFTQQPFHGNPAAVCLLPRMLPTDLLQQIAAENNLSETAFLVEEGEGWHLRWFTPVLEIELCGHATLASSVVLALLQPQRNEFRFRTLSGELRVTRDGERFTLDFPRTPLQPCETDPRLARVLGVPVLHVLQAGKKWLAVVADADTVRRLQPDFAGLRQLDCASLIVTARGDDCDVVSRFFAPKAGVDEDPVTGSAHCALVPYWAGVLGKTTLHARQLSARGGELFCELRGDRVLMAGHGVLFSAGHITVPDAAAAR